MLRHGRLLMLFAIAALAAGCGCGRDGRPPPRHPPAPALFDPLVQLQRRAPGDGAELARLVVAAPLPRGGGARR
jgi:hypothetical protein